jgi:hypothetical protein
LDATVFYSAVYAIKQLPERVIPLHARKIRNLDKDRFTQTATPSHPSRVIHVPDVDVAVAVRGLNFTNLEGLKHRGEEVVEVRTNRRHNLVVSPYASEESTHIRDRRLRNSQGRGRARRSKRLKHQINCLVVKTNYIRKEV